MLIRKISFSLFFVVALACSAQAQTKKYSIPRAVSEQMQESVPVKDGRIVYEGSIPFSGNKDAVFARLQTWFTGSFAEEKTAIDKAENGLLIGHAAHKYKNISGLIANTGFTTFSLKLEVVNGAVSYEISDLKSNESTNGVTGLASTGIKNAYDLTEVYTEHKSGKKSKFTNRQLDNMTQCVYFIQMSLEELVK